MRRFIHSGWSIQLQAVQGASRSVIFAIILLPVTAPAIIDINHNTLSDLWEKTYHNQTLFPATADHLPTADPDGDGWTNAQEAAAGTNPFEANPPDGIVRPELAPETAPGAYTLIWPSLTGKAYQLQCSETLASGTWLDIGNPLLGDGEPIIKILNSQPANGTLPPKLFWRVTITDVDQDGDGLTDAEEYEIGSNPALIDSDGDYLPDAWEVANSLNPMDATGVNGAYGDKDGDGISNRAEYGAGTGAGNAGDFPVHLVSIRKRAYGNNCLVDRSSQEPYWGHAFWSGSSEGSADFSTTYANSSYLQARLDSSPFPATPELAAGWDVGRESLPPAIEEFSYSHFIDGHDQVSGLQPQWGYEGDFAARRVWIKAPALASPQKFHYFRRTENTTGPYEDPTGTLTGVQAVAFEIPANQTCSAPVDLTPEAPQEANVRLVVQDRMDRFFLQDNLVATGVDDVSITSRPTDIGHQEKFWIMAPSGTVPSDPPGTGGLCENESYSTLPYWDLTSITCPGVVATKSASRGILWRSTRTDSADLSPTFHFGAHAVSNLPVGVKAMKRRTVKVICYMVRMPGYSDDIITCGEAHLEATLNQTFAYQINAWFDVEIKTPTVYTVDYDVDNNLWMNATTAEGNTNPDAAKIISDVPRDQSGDIHIYFTNFHVAKSDTPPRLPGEEGSAGPHAATPKDGNNIFVGPWRSLLSSDVERTRVLAHEIGHVMCGEGHPDQGSGAAPLDGTNRLERLMFSDIKEKIRSTNLYNNLLVKKEWDKAEEWLKDNIDNKNQ